MYNEYYGAPSTPTSDYLAHYGVKGMKWGVRKAIERGSSRALSRQYKRAEKKLAKLQDRANTQHQMNVAKAAQRDRRLSAVYGGTLGAVGLGSAAYNVKRAIDSARKTGYGVANVTGVPLAIGAGALAAGSMAANSVRRHRALNRATGAGHQKAVQKEQQFRKEMKQAFRGTEYANKIGKRANEISNKRRARTISYLSQKDQLPLKQSAKKKRR